MRTIIALFLLALLLSCSKKQYDTVDAVAPAMVGSTLASNAGGGETKGDFAGARLMEKAKEISSEAPSEVAPSSAAPSIAKPSVNTLMLIRTAQLAFQVKSFEKARAEIRQIYPRFSAYLSAENETGGDGRRECSMTFRVPSEKFEPLIDALSRSVTRFDVKQISTEDVGEEFSDLTARLGAKREVEKRYLDILTKAVRISDILEVEQKIGETRGEIESMVGRLNYLSNRVSLSTVNISFYEQQTALPPHRTGFFGDLISSFLTGWYGLLAVLVGLMRSWPLAVVLLVIVLIIRGRKSAKGK